MRGEATHLPVTLVSARPTDEYPLVALTTTRSVRCHQSLYHRGHWACSSDIFLWMHGVIWLSQMILRLDLAAVLDEHPSTGRCFTFESGAKTLSCNSYRTWAPSTKRPVLLFLTLFWYNFPLNFYWTYLFPMTLNKCVTGMGGSSIGRAFT